LSARGTSTLLNNALLSAHFLFADDTPRMYRQLHCYEQGVYTTNWAAHFLGDPLPDQYRVRL